MSEISTSLSSEKKIDIPDDNLNKNYIKIKDIPELNQSHCKIKDISYVEKVINELINGGPRKLQFITDFDFTLTKQKLDNGEKVLSSFCMINSIKSLPKEYIDDSNKLLAIYRPIEINPNIPHDEKVKYMIEWWTHSSEILKGFRLTEEEIDEVTYHYRNALRNGTKELFETLNNLNVPVLVFSAGLGDSVKSLLKQANIILPNVKIVSNFLQYDENGLLNGFQDKLIHIFNKNELALKGTEYYDLVHDRDHVIVIGDSLGDANMATGVSNTSYVLKIGFLFDHAEENLERYMDTFDIVLVDDQTMNVPTAIISLIKQNS